MLGQSFRGSTILSISVLTSPGFSPEEPPDDKWQPFCAWASPTPRTTQMGEPHSRNTIVFTNESEN